MPQENGVLCELIFSLKVDSLLGGYKLIMTLIMPIGFFKKMELKK
jgi:hypothetical protein